VERIESKLLNESVDMAAWYRRLLATAPFGGCGAGVEQSASTDQGRLVAVVFSEADKGPSVSAVVQLTSDYCTVI